MSQDKLQLSLLTALESLPGTAEGGLGLAVSGGIDSMVLMHTVADLVQSGALERKVRVLHLNHGLRPDSAEDGELVARESGQRALELSLGTIDVAGRHAALGGSLEAVARDLRYAWLMERAREFGLAAILTAHHAGDQAETVAMRLLRGTGLLGLGGIPERRPLLRGSPVILLRPFLEVGRSAIEDAARSRSIPFREDSTNTDLAHRRNLVRHVVLPLARVDDAALDTQLATLGHAVQRTDQRVRRLGRHLAHTLFSEAVVDGDRATQELSLADLRSLPVELAWSVIDQAGRSVCPDLPPLPTRILVPLLTESERPLHLEVRRDLHIDVDPREVAAKIRLVHSLPPGEGTEDWTPRSLALPGSVTIPGHEGTIDADLEDAATPSHSPFEQWLSPRVLTGALQVRRPKIGERMEAFGLGGTKLVADLLAEGGVHADHRFSYPVVADDEGILWIPGIRAAERCRIIRHEPPLVRLSWRKA
ncbi:MAG: tRNA lysidine(34) synthetase TilS [Planctomycetes bacterium]|nr:tRNA lysidine(34) synthetase TilS [Planctomycetota bacterium]